MTTPLTGELMQPGEVRQLVGTAKPEEQSKLLREWGIPHRLLNRRILVSRFHVREWLAGHNVAPARGINLAAVK